MSVHVIDGDLFVDEKKISSRAKSVKLSVEQIRQLVEERDLHYRPYGDDDSASDSEEMPGVRPLDYSRLLSRQKEYRRELSIFMTQQRNYRVLLDEYFMKTLSLEERISQLVIRLDKVEAANEQPGKD